MGKIGKDGGILLNKLEECGVETKHITIDEGSTGHANIRFVGIW
jgi:hypothetical protein